MPETKQVEISSAANTGQTSMASTQRQTKAAQPKSEEQRKQAHEKHLLAFKEFCCRTLDPYFESQGFEFVDPDEDVVLSDSQESEFVYDLPDGYNSQDENNPDYISMMSSGNSSNGDDD